MTQTRLLTTTGAAERYGFMKDGKPNTRAFLFYVSKNPGFPRPAGSHHLMWDSKAIDQWLDTKNNLTPTPSNSVKNQWMEAFKNGELKGAIPRTAHI